MAETNEQNTSSDADLDTTLKANKSSNHLLIGIIVFLLLISGFVWTYLEQNKVNEAVTTKLNELENASSLKDQHVSAMDAANAKLKQQLSELIDQQQLLTEKINILSDSQTLTGGDVKQFWTLAEVTYLLNTANQRVLLEYDSDSAQVALAMADELIKELNDYRLHPLRELLAQEQLALASVAKPDIQGMTLQIDSAIKMVDQLQVLMAAPVAIEQQQSSLSMMDVESWKGIASQAWQQIKSLVVIRHQQDGSAAVLVPEQRYFLYQNLKLKLETAQHALLSGNAVVFKASLDSAAEWLKTYFVGDKRDAMLSMVEQLQAQEINVELPDISGSSTWLKGFKS